MLKPKSLMSILNAFSTSGGKQCPDCGCSMGEEESCPECGYGEAEDSEMEDEEDSYESGSDERIIEIRDDLQRLVDKLSKLVGSKSEMPEDKPKIASVVTWINQKK